MNTAKAFSSQESTSDRALAGRIGSFIRQQRLGRLETQEQVASRANISRSTLSLLERGETVTVATLIQVLRVLDQLQVLDSFTAGDTVSPLALLRAEKRKRRRARGAKRPDKQR
jgi:transcriptional regulator with XRE-family HTH domain